LDVEDVCPGAVDDELQPTRRAAAAAKTRGIVRLRRLRIRPSRKIG
jgi:hypothetical protein